MSWAEVFQNLGMAACGLCTFALLALIGFTIWAWSGK